MGIEFFAYTVKIATKFGFIYLLSSLDLATHLKSWDSTVYEAIGVFGR